MRIVWNGYTLENNVQVDSLDSTPVYADDGISHLTTRHNIRGTARISGTSATAFRDDLADARARLLRPRNAGEDFLIEWKDGTDLVSLTSTAVDQMEGPLGEFKVQAIHGVRAAVVAFDITWHDYEALAGESKQDVISHRWTAEWDVDDVGQQVYRVAGVIVIRPDTSATGAGAEATGTNVDAYRRLILPNLPDGFRRNRMTFGTDETGNRLIYMVECKEYARDVPFPAHTGRGVFIWTRGYGESPGPIGVKVFEAELAAPRSVSAAALHDAAVKCSKRRIDWNKDYVQLIQMREELFGENRITIKVMAQAASTEAGELEPLNFSMYGDILSGQLAGQSGPPAAVLPGYADQSPYGDALLRSVRRALYKQVDSSAAGSQAGGPFPSSPVPKASFETQPVGEPVDTVYTFEPPLFEEMTETILDGALDRDTTSQSHIDNPYLAVRMFDEVVVADSGMRAHKPQDIGSPDIAVQLRRPVVMLISEAVLVRKGAPPVRPTRPPPPGAILRRDVWKPGIGSIDQANSHVFVAVHRQEWELLAQGQPQWPIQGFGDDAFMGFHPPLNTLRMPPDPRIAASLQGNILSAGGDIYDYPAGTFGGYATS